MAKRKIDPETRAEWAEGRRRMAEMLERRERIVDELVARRSRRRARLHRLTFGLFGR